MHYKQIAEEPITYVVFETGDELAARLKQLASELTLASSGFTAIGALSSVKLGWFDWKTKKYDTSVTLDEQLELVSLAGDDGDSHVKRGTLEVKDVIAAGSIEFKEDPPHSSLDWHNAPTTQYVLFLSGALEFGMRSGESFTVSAGRSPDRRGSHRHRSHLGIGERPAVDPCLRNLPAGGRPSLHR
jgi:hypothetical protein